MLNKMNDAVKYLDVHEIKAVAARTTKYKKQDEETPFAPGKVSDIVNIVLEELL